MTPTATSLTNATAQVGVVLTRQARATAAALPRAARPRCFVVGPAGSGKSTVLALMVSALREAGRTVVVAGPDTDPAAFPATTVVVVDDLQSLSEGHLAGVLARAGDPEASLVVAMRPWPRPGQAIDIARCLDREAPPVVLGQVARSDVLAHLDDSGVTLSDACLTHVLRTTGGVTWLVTHALASHDERDCVDDPGHRALDEAVQAQVAHRLDTLPTPVRRAIEHLGAGPSGTTLALVAAATAGDTIEHGHADGLLLRNGDTVPAVRAAARAAMPAHRRAELDTPLDGEDLLVRQGLEAWAAGDLTATASAIEAIPATPTPTRADTVTALAAGVWAARGMMTTASDVFWAHRTADGPGAGASTIAHVGAGHAERLRDVAPSTRPEGASSTALVAAQLLDRGLRASLAPVPPGHALVDLLRGAELHLAAGSLDPLPELPPVVAAAVALGTGEFAAARQLIDAAVLRSPSGTWSRRRLLLWQAWLALQGERTADARASLAAAERIVGATAPRDTILLESVRVGLVRRHDTLAALEAVWKDALERVRHIDVDLYTALPFTTLLTAAARTGDAATLAHQATRLQALLAALGSPPAWGTHVWWAFVQQGILLNEPELLAPHARALVAAAPSNPMAAVMARAGAVWTAVLGGVLDADAVEDAARSLAGAGLAWDGARLAGHGSRRSEDRRVVARLLAVARELHPRESAARPEEGGAAAGAPAVTSGVLSEREWDVATLVVEGKTYNEIGATIFISPKTVEHHVAHIRRRIGATSRSDLMAKLRVLLEEGRDDSP